MSVMFRFIEITAHSIRFKTIYMLQTSHLSLIDLILRDAHIGALLQHSLERKGFK